MPAPTTPNGSTSGPVPSATVTSHGTDATTSDQPPSLTELRFTAPPNFDSRYLPISLPSSFHFYPSYKDAFTRLLTAQDQFALYRGYVNENARNTVAVVSSCMCINANMLTVGDLWFVMYQLRLLSYRKAPLTVDWVCTSEDHLRRIHEGTPEGQKDMTAEQRIAANAAALSKETLNQRSSISKSNLNVVELKQSAELEELRETIRSDYGWEVNPLLVCDWLQSVDDQEALPVDERETLAFLDSYAGLLNYTKHGTLMERRALIEQADPDALADLDLFKEYTAHGVREEFTVTCKECGAVEQVKYQLNVPHFFPVSQTPKSTRHAVHPDGEHQRASGPDDVGDRRTDVYPRQASVGADEEG